MEREKPPSVSIVEPWWRAWLWAGLPGLFGALGFAVGAVAAYLAILLFLWSQGEEPGKESRQLILMVIVGGGVGSAYGGKVGAALVKRLRGRSGEVPPSSSAPAAEHHVSGADELVQETRPLQRNGDGG